MWYGAGGYWSTWTVIVLMTRWGAWRAFWSTLADAGDLVTPDNVRYLSGYWRLAP